MSAKTIKSALGLLQDDPDNAKAWKELRDELSGDPGMSVPDLVKLLESARHVYESKREHAAVAKILALEVQLAEGPRQGALLTELARILDDEVLDYVAAREAYERLVAMGGPFGDQAGEALAAGAAKEAKWRELVDRYTSEAQGAGDAGFRSSLLVSAAETAYRYGRGESGGEVDRIVGILREAISLDPKNRRAEALLERALVGEGRWEEVVEALDRYAGDAAQKDDRVAALARQARILAKKLKSSDRAVAAYERLLDLSPSHPEATSFLADHFTSKEMWEHLVALYEGQLSSGALRGKEEELGTVLQVAMVHWRMRGKPDAAEPWFEKVRKILPAHQGMLTFFREWCSARGESARLAVVLTEAQRTLPEGPERNAVVAEIAKLAEEGANANKAIEQWRSILRQDPKNKEARDALKRLYRQTAAYNALTDLLRQELEKIPQGDDAARLGVLREIASVYRDHVKSDSALVTVLAQIVQLDPTDLNAVRELVRVYEALQRWRDLLTTQARQADLEPEQSVKAELWRAVARRWLDQFANVQNALESYEKLHSIAPKDREAVERLRELYTKRRAYKPLYDLLAREAEGMGPGPERREVWMEMTKIASERLDVGGQAVALYKKILEEEPGSMAALDGLEKQAERDKDFATVAEALERRTAVAPDDATRLTVLQKLGSIYSDRIHDHAKATTAWRRVLEIQPGHAKALRVLRDSLIAQGDYDGLAALYAQNNDWEGLVDVLSGAADKAADPQLKVDLSFRCATILVEKLNAPDRAFRSYERVLSVRASDARAAAALVPLYESDEKWGRLPALYEILFHDAQSLEDKLGWLEKLVRVCGHELQDRGSAFAWARKAYELSPERVGAMATFEGVARAGGLWAGFADALSARLAVLDAAPPAAPSSASILPEDGTRAGKKKKKKDRERGKERERESEAGGRRDETRLLRARLAEVYAREMGRVDEAIQTYRTLVEEDDTDELAVGTLDRILRESGRADDLRWLFELRIERANTPVKLELLSEWALLEEDALGSVERAIQIYRRMLEIVPEHTQALAALARLLRAQGDAAGAIEIIARDRDQRKGAERAAREVDMARLYVDPLRRYSDALAACERALALTPNDRDVVAVVEHLLPIPDTRSKAARILERAYDGLGEARRQAEVLEVLIATTAAHDDRLRLYDTLTSVHEDKLGDANTAFDVVARAAGEFPAELPLWDRLAVLSAKTGRAQALVDAIAVVVPPEGPTGLPEHVELDLADRAATLFDDKIGDVDRARPYLARMLARQPNSERAFQRLRQILTTREQWSDLESLYEQVIAATEDAVRRTELLAEVALVADDITGDRPKAIGYYERILEVDPAHEQATSSLDNLYGSEQRWDKLARLLERRLQGAHGDDKLDLQQRLGMLLFTRLGDASGALSYLEPVLHDRPNASEARQLVEKILDVPDLRSRAAIVLEAVYTDRDDVPELVRVLEIHLEFAAGADERRDLLRRVADLRDERLRDDAGALDAFARLLPLDPDDARARQRMLEITRRTGAHDRAAGVLTATAAAARAPAPRAEILMDLAHLYEGQLVDQARAEGVYRQVLELSPDDATIALPACRSLERVYAQTDSRRLAEILRIEVKLEDDGEARRELRGRLGELCESVLDDPKAAIEAWRARLDDDPNDTVALSSLDRLLERTQSWKELVEVLRAREKMADDREERRTFLVRIARALADKMSDVEEAILAYRAVVDDFGPDRVSLAALGSLYEVADKWRDLADSLEVDLGLAETAQEKLAVLTRLGTVRRSKLADLEGAVDAYREALALDPSDARCREALESMLDEADARRSVAAILRPLYEADASNEKLLKVLEIEWSHADSVSEKLATIAQAVQVAEGPLGDPARALAFASRGLREAAGDPELPQWIVRAERLAAATGKHAELVELLRAALPDILDGDVQLDVTLRIAEMARSALGNLQLAKEYFVRALDLRGEDRRALVALESLYAELGDNTALLDIVKRRADASEDEAERRELLFKQARLSDEQLGDTRAAIGVYEQILESEQGSTDAHAIAALERLYEQAERWDDLVALYERQAELPGVGEGRKAALHHALGTVLEKRTGDFDRAFAEYEAALKIDPKHPQTVASLEALMSTPDHGARAAELLEPVYQARLDWRRVMTTLEARLTSSQDPDARRQLLRRLAKMHEEQEEDYRAALELYARLLSEDLTDETTWAELERLARVANAEGRLAEIYAAELEKVSSDEPATARLAKRTGELFEAQKDVDRALLFFRRAHTFEPEARDGSFEAIDRLLREAARPRDRVKLYRDALDYTNDPTERLTTLHTIALLEEAELGDESAAVETYRSALDVDDSDRHALEALSRLYARGERWKDLADLTRRRAEQATVQEEEARFRMTLANLLLTRLEESEAAIDELQIVVDIAPLGGSGPAAEAVNVLESLLKQPSQQRGRVVEILRPIYEKSDDWRRTTAVNAERLALATNDGDRISIYRENAKLWEERGGDKGKAFDAMRAAWILDPEDGEAREQLERLAEATKRWDDLAAAYETAIAKTEGLTRRELLSALARLHDSKRDDPRRALDAWSRLLELDDTDLQPLDEIDALATLLSDWTVLVKVLLRKAELLPDDETRASTWRRVGEARRDMLEDASGAIEAYERALEIEPASAFTIDYLIALYEQKGDATRLVDLYQRRVELCGDDDEALKFQLLTDAATRYEQDLGNRRQAIECLNQALSVRAGDAGVLRRLDALYAHERLWPELLDNLKQQVETTKDAEATRVLKKRIAALHAVQLQDAPAALETYREVLSSGFDEEAASAIRSIGEQHDELRGDAADALEPVLRSAGRPAELASVLELRLRAQTEASDRAKTLRAIARVAESELADLERAQSALVRALAEEPQDGEIHSEIERLAERVGAEGWSRYADALQERASSNFEANVSADLFVRLGKVAEEKLGDAARAAGAYGSASERMGDDAGILAALDRLHVRLGDGRALAEVLERRISVEADAKVQADLLHRLAVLQLRDGEKPRGLATLRQALERVPDHAASRESLEALLVEEALFDDAFEALEFVHRTLGKSEDLAALYERRVARAPSTRDRTRARLELARVLEESVSDRMRAQKAVEAAVADDPSEEDALAELARLAAANSGWGSAADALDGALERGGEELPAATRTELWVKLAEWRRDKLSQAAKAEDAYAKALAIDPENVEVLRALEDIRRAPGRERELVHTLRTRARLETDLETKRTLLREAKALAEGPVGDRELAEAMLRDLLNEDEGDLWALEELAKLRGAAGDDAEVVTLLLKRAELVSDGSQALALRHQAARVLVEKLKDAARAMALYEEILDAEPSDAEAATALRALYSEAGKHKELAKLLTRLIDVASSAEERSRLRVELARIQSERFKAPDDAVETLRAILDEEPGHAEAVLTLSQLYEQTGRDSELADLLKAQLDAARERGDQAAELTLLVRLGEVEEGRLGDVAAAVATYGQVLERDGSHRGALEAVARIGEKRGEWERASSALTKLVDLASDVDGVPWALKLAQAREKLGDAEGAEAALQRGLRLDPSNTGLRGTLRTRWEKAEKWSELATLLVGDADLVAAANPGVKVAEAAPNKSLVPGQGRPSLSTGGAKPGAGAASQPEIPAPVAEQLKLLKAAADIHLSKRKSPSDAIPILERAAGLVPQDRDLLLLLGDAYTSADRGRDAARVLERVIASFGGKRTKEVAGYHLRLARALNQLGEKEQALAQLDMGFKVDPGSVAILKDLGVLAFETNDLDRAQKTFRALLLQRLDAAAGISKGEVFYYLGEISAKQGDKPKAVQMFERALENDASLAKAKAKLAELKG
jgi:tetratricopeptide (TPR) repeat protein